MPLTNDVIVKLNEITMAVSDKARLEEAEVELIREIFGDILKKGLFYDVDEIGSWFENEGSWKNKSVRLRIQNIAHYMQSRHEQASPLKMIGDDHRSDGSCGC